MKAKLCKFSGKKIKNTERKSKVKLADRKINYLQYLGDNYITPAEWIVMEEWGTWLKEFPWEWYVTLTFKFDVSLDGAKRRLKRGFRPLNRRRNGKAGYFTVIELQKNRKVYHFHLLMLGVGKSLPRTWEGKWYFGHAKIRPYNEDLKAVYYLAKKIAKKEARDYFFGGILRNADMAKEIMKTHIQTKHSSGIHSE